MLWATEVMWQLLPSGSRYLTSFRHNVTILLPSSNLCFMNRRCNVIILILKSNTPFTTLFVFTKSSIPLLVHAGRVFSELMIKPPAQADAMYSADVDILKNHEPCWGSKTLFNVWGETFRYLGHPPLYCYQVVIWSWCL